MSEHSLPRVARRIFPAAHLISPAGAANVLAALAPRLGIGYLVEPSGHVLNFDAGNQVLPSKEAHNLGLPARNWDSSRDFAFDEATGIAHIPIEGELVHRFGHLDPHSGMTGYDGIKLKVQAAHKDESVKGILLDIDSPGGEVYGLEGAAKAILAARVDKPVWAMVNEYAASAAYWLASAADRIFLPPLGDVGSIGAVIIHKDVSGALEQAGVVITLIHAPKDGHKVDWSPIDGLSDEARDELQGRADFAYARFVAGVAEGRGISEDAVRATEARVLMAPDALAAGLIDAIAFEDEVTEEFAARLARPQPAALPRNN